MATTALAAVQLLSARVFWPVPVGYDDPQPLPAGLSVDLDNGDIINYAAARGVGSAIFSPMARGVLTDLAVAGADRHPLAGTGILRNMDNYQRLVRRASAFKFLSLPGKRALHHAAIQFILAHPAVTTVLGGFSALEQIDEMLGLLDAPALTAAELAAIEQVWARDCAEA